MNRSASASDSTPGERLGKLGDVAALVGTLAGARVRVAADASIIDDAYGAGSTLARARFDDLAAAAAALASAGVEAVLGCEHVAPAALTTLADVLESEIAQLERLLLD